MQALGVIIISLFCIGFCLTAAALAGLRLLRFRATNGLDYFLTGFVLGMAYWGVMVYLLITIGIYSRLTAFVAFVIPCLYILLKARPSSVAQGSQVGPGFCRPANLDRAAAVVAGVFLIVAFCDAVTSPITWWDAYIVWDKWACDWAQGSSLRRHLLGGYPQLLPFFSSVLYALTGSATKVLPLECFALHATHVILGTALVAVAWRLASLLELPAWPLLLILFGNRTLREHLLSGTADVLLVALFGASLCLVLSYRAGQWQSRIGLAGVLAPGIFALCFTKATGFLALPVLWFVSRTDLASGTGGSGNKSAPAQKWPYLLAALLIISFYAQQTATELWLPPRELDVYSVNFSMSGMGLVLRKVASQDTASQNIVLLGVAKAKKLLLDYGVGEILWPFYLAFIVIALTVSLRHVQARALLLPLLPYGLVWLYWGSYDTRNLLPPLLALGPPLFQGASKIAGRGPWRGARQWTVAFAAASLVICSTHPLLSETLARLKSLLQGPASISHRWDAMRAGPDERIRLYFPHRYADYRFLTGLPLAAKASHVLATDHLYRWLPNGSYALCHWPHAHLRPGDLYVSTTHQPPAYENWTLVKSQTTQEAGVWVYTPDSRSLSDAEISLTGVNPPSRKAGPGLLHVVFGGTQSLVVHNVTTRDLGPGSAIVWRVTLNSTQSPPGVKPMYLLYDHSLADPGASRLAVDVSTLNRARVHYSGLLTLRKGNVSKHLVDGILVGIGCDEPGVEAFLSEFRLSIFR